MRPSKDELFLAYADLAALRSGCSKVGVGCVLTDAAGEHLAIGYNGLWAGGPDECGARRGEPCHCVHAEANAVAKAGSLERPLTAYVTLPPCATCAILLVNAGVTRIVRPPTPVAWTQKMIDGEVILEAAGVAADACRMLTN